MTLTMNEVTEKKIAKGYCGECDNECDIDELCVAGKCETDCGGGLVECGGECVDLLTDNDNCGGCDI